MSEEKNVPNIRFKGFTDPWEQRKLGEIMDVGSVKRIHQSDWKNEGIRFLRARDIVAFSKKEEPKDQLYIDKDKYDEYSKISGKVKPGDLLVTGVGSIGVPMLIKSKNPVYFKDGNIIWFKNNNSLLDGDFFYYSFTSNRVQSFIKKSSGAGTVGTYTIDNGKKTPIQISKSQSEQKQIGEFLNYVDSLIALHQQKVTQLKELKKLLMQKIFDQEWRFKGFTDPWEQRKLDDVSSKVTEKNKSKKYTETLTNSAEHGIIKQYDFFDKSISNSNSITSYYVVKRDNFVYNPRISTAAPVGPINRNRLNIIGIMSPLYYVFEATNIDKSYLEYYFKTTKWHNFMKIEGNTGARSDRLAIKDKVFVKMPIPYPKVKEQKQIGELFESVDTTIALHQQKVDQLKELKKYLMQNLFV